MTSLSRPAATLIGFSAILLWSFLAFFTAASGTMPPFQLTAVTFGIGGLAGVALWTLRPHAIKALRQPWQVWLLGVGGLFGYHLFYFTSLRNAPPVEAGRLMVLDGGVLGNRPPSTVVDCTRPQAQIVREGTLSVAELRYTSGLTNYLSVLDAQRTLLAAEVAVRDIAMPLLAAGERAWCRRLARALMPGCWPVAYPPGLTAESLGLAMLRAWLPTAAWARVRLHYHRALVEAGDAPTLNGIPAARLAPLWHAVIWRVTVQPDA